MRLQRSRLAKIVRPSRARMTRPTVDRLEERALRAAPSLALTLASHFVQANSGLATTTGTLTVTGSDTSAPLNVSLTSSNPSLIQVPAIVVIPAGQTSVTFNVDATSPSALGNQTVTISGAANAEAQFSSDLTFSTSAQSFMTDSIALTPNGGIFAAGILYTGNSQNYYDMAVTKYLPNGGIDTTFNGGGVALTAITGQLVKAQAVAVQPDGKVVVGGVYQVSGDAHFNFALSRFNADGTVDTTFGNNGLVQITPSTGYYNEIWSLAVSSDGKILIGGDVDNNSPTYDDFAVARLNTNGSLDTTFGNAGYAETSFASGADRGFQLALQSDGKILLAGSSFGGNSTSHFALARFTTSGQLDSTFGAGGKVSTDVPGDFEGARSLAIQPDGKIVLAGSVSNTGVYPPVYNFALARYNTNGSIDTTFGSSGVVIKDFGGNDSAGAVVVDSNGMITVGGAGGANGGLVVARFTPNGTFAQSIINNQYGIQAMAIQPGGRVVAAGSSTSLFNQGFVTAFTGTSVVNSSDSLTVAGTGSITVANDSYTATRDLVLNIAAPGVLGNDTDPSGLTLSAALVNGPTHGKLTLNADGSFSYTPNANYLGSDQFTYQASDGTSTSSVATVSLNVTGTDDPPVSANDSYSLLVPGTLSIQSPGVLSNDSDINGQAITAQLVSNPGHGSLTLNANGSFSYTPVAGFYGTDSFTYQANDGTLSSNVATVTISVYGKPVAVADTYSANENTTLTVSAPGVLANDSDPNGLALTPIVSAYPQNGSLTLNSDGSFTYVPRANFYGQDTFSYYVRDSKAQSAPVTDTINVSFVDRAPTANDDSYTLNENATLTLPVITSSVQMTSQKGDYIGQGLTYNYSPANATISAHVMSGGAYQNTIEVDVNGNNGDWWYLRFVAPNNAILTPGVYNNATRWPFEAAGSPGLDISGNGRGSNTSTGQFTVTVAQYDASGNITAFQASFVQHSEGAPPALTGTVSFGAGNGASVGVLGNDTDPDAGQTLTAKLITNPSHGSLTFNSNGTFTYTPTTNYSGTDSFTYVANDGTLDSNVATVHLTIASVDHAPVANNDQYVAATNTPLNVPAQTGVLANDTDADHDPLTSIVVSQPSHGSLKLNTDGSFTYTPASNYFGPDSFTYKANDGQLDSNVGTASLTVDQPPTASNGSTSTNVDVPVAVSLSASDPEGSALTYTIVTAPAHGTLSGTAPNLTYTPSAGYNGADSFSFTASDGSFSSNVASVSLSVNQIVPTLTWNTPNDITYGFGLNANQLNATANVAGTFSYTPAPGTVLGVGAGQSLSAIFTPTDTVHYTSATVATTINVLQATPNISWPTPADIVYGTALGSTQLNAMANTPGTFSYSIAAGTVLSAGAGQVLTVTFTPNDTADYKSATASTTINVLKATPLVTWANPAAIVYGTAISSTQLNATANVAGTFSYATAPGTVLNAGAGQSLTVTFTPNDTADYNTTTASATINVLKATPTVTWAAPASIVYGTALGATQLNAQASVPGTFTYTPAAGKILNAGTGLILTAIFTPTDASDYATVNAQTTITVRKAHLSLTAVSVDIGHGDPLPNFTYIVKGLLNGDTTQVLSGAPSITTTATSASPIGTYPINITAGTITAANYDVSGLYKGTLTIHPKVLDVRVTYGSRSMSLIGLSRDLPFSNISAIDIIFSDDMTIASSDLSLKSTVSKQSYTLNQFSYNATSHDAKWNIPSGLDVDRLLLALDNKFGAKAAPTLTVLNTTPIAFNVLPGDFTGDGVVDSADSAGIQNLVGASTSNPSAVWADLDGNNVVDSNDVSIAIKRRGTRV